MRCIVHLNVLLDFANQRIRRMNMMYETIRKDKS